MTLNAKAIAVLASATFLLIQHAASFAQEDSSGNTFHLSVSNGLYPIINAMTDLPDGTALFINVQKPWLPDGAQRVARGLPACGDDCAPAVAGPRKLMGETVTVEGGAFTAGPFSFFGKPFPPGAYPIEISSSVDINTATPEQIRTMGIVLYRSVIRVSGDEYGDRPASPARQCFDLSKGQPDSLSGTLNYIIFAGPPNYENVQKGDEPEPTYVLRLPEPICITGDDFADRNKLFRDVQVSETPRISGQLKRHLHEKVTLALDRPMAAENGHHHEPLVADVTAIAR